ncbi:MAG: right-handed parallel beta-helix repeat-containing protein [Promethearchaeota archaeon]
MKNQKRNYFSSLIFIWLLIFVSIIFSPVSLNLKIEKQESSFKTSNYWIIYNQIHIKNNWSESEAIYDFITGSGTFSDPYKIENITFNNHKNSGDAIIIENSLDYFMIRNCTIKNSGTIITDSEITIINSTKGTLMNNTISSNMGYGIHLVESYNNLILENKIYNNTYIGIGLNESDNNIINLNKVYYHGREAINGFGIVLLNSHKNNISQNVASHNTAIGILLYNSSYNNVTINKANNNYLGLQLSQNSNYNNVIGNDLKGNNYCYTVDDDSEGNNIEGNDCGAVGFEYYFFLVSFGVVFALTLIGLIIVIRKRRKFKKEKNELN